MRLAEAKRRVRAGMMLEAVGHYNPKVTGPRAVTRVGGSGFYWRGAFHRDSDRAAYTQWPPASRTLDDGPNAITLLMDDGRLMTTLTFPPEPEA